MEGRDRKIASRALLIKTILSDPCKATKPYNFSSSEPDCDQVYPGIFIGDECSARDRNCLRANKITHVVNTAAGKGFGMVNTGESYYNGWGIKYLGLELSDLSVSDASRYFFSTANFIDAALAEKGNILVHCMMGISRSSTIVIAFLMIKRNMSAVQAITKVRENRDIRPNVGFITQLAALDVALEKNETGHSS